MTAVSLWMIFTLFFKISTFTVGGGYVMIPVFREEIVERRRWLRDDEMLTIIATAQSLPGIFAVNTAICVGVRVRGFLGAVAAVIGVVLPPFLAIVIIASWWLTASDSALLNNALAGVRAGVTALILVALLKMRKTACPKMIDYLTAAAALTLMWLWKINPLWIIGAAAAIGVLIYLENWYSLERSLNKQAPSEKSLNEIGEKSQKME